MPPAGESVYHYKKNKKQTQSVSIKNKSERIFGINRRMVRIEMVLAPQVGLEPTTTRLTAECSTIELLRNAGIRRRPTLPARHRASTLSAEGLNCCVRNGNRWNPFAIAAGNGTELSYPSVRYPDNRTYITWSVSF